MSWHKLFEVAGIVILVESEETPCDRSLQAIVTLYHEISEENRPDVVFSIRKLKKKIQLLLNQQELLWEAEDERDIAPALEIHIYRQILQRTFPHFLSLHASCVNIDGMACMFAGQSGAGKSSLCTAALLTGAHYFTDEFSLLSKDGLVYPFPRPLQWDEEEHPAFDGQNMIQSGLFNKEKFGFLEANTNHLVTSHLWLPKHVQVEALPLQIIVLPRYHPDSPEAEMVEIRRGEAIMALPEHIHLHYPDAASDIQQLNQRISNDCRFFRLDFSNVIKAWALSKETVLKLKV